MNRKIFLYVFILLISFLLNINQLSAQTSLKVPSIFSDNMILQRNIKILFWGTAAPGIPVTVKIDDSEFKGAADKDGRWKISAGEMKAGGPHSIEITDGKSSIKFSNVLIGDVWLCSGQSNMNMPLAGWGRIKNYKEEIAAADYPEIRLLTVPLTLAPEPLSDVKTDGWKICTPENIREFSAAAYFFGREIYKTEKIPIGLLHSSKGGTPVESWMSRENLKEFPEFDKKINFVTDSEGTEKYARLDRQFKINFKEWIAKLNKAEEGLNEADSWYAENVDDSGWMDCNVPGIIENNGLKNFDGVVWFRKEIDLPESWAGQKIHLSLGPVDDMDITYFNGEKIGQQDSKNNPSEYDVPAGLVKTGRNIIAVRVIDLSGNGGIWGLPSEIFIRNEDGNEIPLTGIWKMKSSVDLKTLPKQPARPNLDRYPIVLFNGMINPLIPFGIKGAIWYQGESNAERAYQYRELFPRMIKEWREKWGEGDFPFYFVQLARYKSLKAQPADDSWAELREAQAKALSLPNTGMVVIIETGDSLNVHPKDKQIVGRRLALIALHNVYGENVEYSGPVYKSMEIRDGRIILGFDHIGGGLTTKDGEELKGFAIAGADRKFVWAEAKIVDDKVVVWNENITKPVAVRYAWASFPVCNLTNKAGLPAGPFRTDDWPGITINKK